MNIADFQNELKKNDCNKALKMQYILKYFEENGELSEAIRHYEKGANDTNTEIANELYDVFYYLTCIANLYDISLEEAFTHKYNANKKRWAEGYISK